MAESKKQTSQEICSKIRELVGRIQELENGSGDDEIFWREHQQHLLRILAEHPWDVYPLDTQTKEAVSAIVTTYLYWSFNAQW